MNATAISSFRDLNSQSRKALEVLAASSIVVNGVGSSVGVEMRPITTVGSPLRQVEYSFIPRGYFDYVCKLDLGDGDQPTVVESSLSDPGATRFYFKPKEDLQRIIAVYPANYLKRSFNPERHSNRNTRAGSFELLSAADFRKFYFDLKRRALARSEQ